MGFVVLAGVAVVGASGQSTAQPKKVLTPEQVAYQQATCEWFTRYDALRRTAQQALAVEQNREKAGDCPKAGSTVDVEECLSREIETTRDNYKKVTGALRAMLVLAPPEMPGEGPVSGPTGTPPTAPQRVAEFDRLEAASEAYRKLAAGAAYDEYKGGTLAPVFSAEAQQKLLRSHLAELAFVYESEFSNR